MPTGSAGDETMFEDENKIRQIVREELERIIDYRTGMNTAKRIHGLEQSIDAIRKSLGKELSGESSVRKIVFKKSFMDDLRDAINRREV